MKVQILGLFILKKEIYKIELYLRAQWNHKLCNIIIEGWYLYVYVLHSRWLNHVSGNILYKREYLLLVKGEGQRQNFFWERELESWVLALCKKQYRFMLCHINTEFACIVLWPFLCVWIKELFLIFYFMFRTFLF